MRPFAKLRGEIAAHDIEHSDFAKGIGLSKSAVSQRFNGHKQWKLSEMYAAMDFFGLPYSQLNEYFPPFKQRGTQGGEHMNTEDKQRALNMLVYALHHTRAGADVGAIAISEDGDAARVYTAGGYIDVNIALDSAIAAIIDVCKALM